MKAYEHIFDRLIFALPWSWRTQSTRLERLQHWRDEADDAHERGAYVAAFAHLAETEDSESVTPADRRDRTLQAVHRALPPPDMSHCLYATTVTLWTAQPPSADVDLAQFAAAEQEGRAYCVVSPPRRVLDVRTDKQGFDSAPDSIQSRERLPVFMKPHPAYVPRAKRGNHYVLLRNLGNRYLLESTAGKPQMAPAHLYVLVQPDKTHDTPTVD